MTLIGTLSLLVMLGTPLVANTGTPAGLRATLLSLDDTAYLGGIEPQVREMAPALRAAVARDIGSRLPSCEKPDPLSGEVIIDPNAGKQAPVVANEWLKTLRDLLGNPNPAVRDAAAWLLGEIGPAAAIVVPDLRPSDHDRSPWFTHALSRVSCQAYGMTAPLMGLPALAFEAADIERTDGLSVAQRVQLAAFLLDRRDLVWPEGWFEAFVESYEHIETPSTPALIALASVAADVDRLPEHRNDALRLLRILGPLPPEATGLLAGVMRDVDDDVAWEAAWALHDNPSELDGEAALSLLRRHSVDVGSLNGRSCTPYANTSKQLLSRIAAVLQGPNWDDATAAAKRLGCLRDVRAIPVLLRALEHASWEVVESAVKALSAHIDKPEVRLSLAQLREAHWSGLIRKAASETLDPPPPESDPETIELTCFHRCPTNHLNSQCGDERGIVDGIYMAPGLGEVDVIWNRVRRQPIPAAISGLVHTDSRANYGSNDFKRLASGWLVASDRWHYDGELSFIDEAGQKQSIQQFGEDGIALLDSPHFGNVVLARSLFGVGKGGLLATIEGTPGNFSLSYRAVLPSPPWGWAMAPDGTLLVADPYNTVAVTSEGSIQPLDCPLKAPRRSASTLLRLALRANGAPLPPEVRDASIDVRVIEQLRATQAQQAADDNNPAIHRRWYVQDVYEHADALTLDGRAAAALALIKRAELTEDERKPSQEIPILLEVGDTKAAQILLKNSPPSESRALAFFHGALAVVSGNQSELDNVLEALRSEEDEYSSLLRRAAGRRTTPIDVATPSNQDVRLQPWPKPIAAFLDGHIDEAALVLASHRRDGRINLEHLCEALVYVGLDLARRGERRAAQRHLAAAVRLGMRHYTEHTMAALAVAALNDGRRSRK